MAIQWKIWWWVASEDQTEEQVNHNNPLGCDTFDTDHTNNKPAKHQRNVKKIKRILRKRDYNSINCGSLFYYMVQDHRFWERNEIKKNALEKIKFICAVKGCIRADTITNQESIVTRCLEGRTCWCSGNALDLYSRCNGDQCMKLTTSLLLLPCFGSAWELTQKVMVRLSL
jgi:hypothetical protein